MFKPQILWALIARTSRVATSQHRRPRRRGCRGDRRRSLFCLGAV